MRKIIYKKKRYGLPINLKVDFSIFLPINFNFNLIPFIVLETVLPIVLQAASLVRNFCAHIAFLVKLQIYIQVL